MKKLKNKSKSTKRRRVILGVGHPWFLGPTHTTLGLSSSNSSLCTDLLTLTKQDLGAYNKIRLIAEILE